MDPDAPWLLDDDFSAGGDTVAVETATVSSGEVPTTGATSSIPTGPPVPNPYAHILEVPHHVRQFTHWARNKHLQYKYLTEYANVYYDDYVNYVDKRQRGIDRDVPRPQEWPERVLRLYAREGERLTNDSQYWNTDKNKVKDKCSIFHAVHSKDYYRRQYKILT